MRPEALICHVSSFLDRSARPLRSSIARVGEHLGRLPLPMALAAATCAMFFITPDVPAAKGHTAATSSPTTHSGAKSKKGGARTSGPSAKALAAEIDSLVAQALAASKQATRGLGSSGPIAFDGVAWETGEGVDAGTSPVGTELSDAIRTSLTQHGVSTEVAGVGARGLGVGRILKGGFRLLKSGLELSLVVSDASGLPVGRVSKILTNVVGLSSGAMHLEEVLPPDSENLKGLVRLMRKTVLAGQIGRASCRERVYVLV